MPPGYRKGHHKYVIVVGTVMTGLGKGIFSSSLAKLLQDKGLKVAPIKMEGYLNIDSGTLNPYRHGEVFVLDDGMETDMDLGTYERLLDQDLSAANFTTNGQILSAVLKKEREGGYLGRDVQVIPHVDRRDQAASSASWPPRATPTSSSSKSAAPSATTRTAFYLEACRQLAYEEGEDSRRLRRPDLRPRAQRARRAEIQGRPARHQAADGSGHHAAHHRLPRRPTRSRRSVREKISMYTNVPMRRVVSHARRREHLPRSPTPSATPAWTAKCSRCSTCTTASTSAAKTQPARSGSWFVDRIGKAKKDVTIAVTGKYAALRDAYASIIKAGEHCGVHLGVNVNFKWIDTTDDRRRQRRPAASRDCHGIIVPGGFGVRGTEGKIECIRYARENKVPYLGLCLGFQMAVIEYARNVCGIARRQQHASSSPTASRCVIDILPEQKKIEGLGGNMRLGGKDVELKPGTLACAALRQRRPASACASATATRSTPSTSPRSKSTAWSSAASTRRQPIMQVLELPQDVHPYFLGTQAHPELTSRPLRPQPLFMGLIKAAMEFAEVKEKQPQAV